MAHLRQPTAEQLHVSTVFADDLRYLRAALLAADVPFLLIRTVRDRPGLAVDARYSLLVAATLAEAAADGYARDELEPGVVRFGATRPGGGYVAGPEIGVELEFWEYRADTVRCPRPNVMTRPIFPRADVTAAAVRLAECDWPTLAGMFDRGPDDVGFDIDIVYSWVDGSDPAWRARRAAYLDQAVVGEGDDAEARIRQIDELRYALRSVHRYAPWVRRIFLVTDSAVPGWLGEHPRVTVVRAEDHFSDTAALPTFNSHAVESQLQHIDGLSEHFLYSNDDMFFARPVSASMFFTPGGISKFFEAGTRIGPGRNDERRSGFENAARVNRRLLAERFGTVITRHLEHTPAPLRRSVLWELEDVFAEDFARTRDSRFRSATDISVTNSLYHYYALLTGRAVPREAARMRYVDTTTEAGLGLLDGLRTRREVDFFCLNDGSFPEVDEAYRGRMVSQFLADYFPDPAPWERVSGAGRRGPEPARQGVGFGSAGRALELEPGAA
jgi:hypothetical protein